MRSWSPNSLSKSSKSEKRRIQNQARDGERRTYSKSSKRRREKDVFKIQQDRERRTYSKSSNMSSGIDRVHAYMWRARGRDGGRVRRQMYILCENSCVIQSSTPPPPPGQLLLVVVVQEEVIICLATCLFFVFSCCFLLFMSVVVSMHETVNMCVSMPLLCVC